MTRAGNRKWIPIAIGETVDNGAIDKDFIGNMEGNLKNLISINHYSVLQHSRQHGPEGLSHNGHLINYFTWLKRTINTSCAAIFDWMFFAVVPRFFFLQRSLTW